MKKVIVSAALLLAITAQAQVSKIQVGKKVQIESNVKTTTKVNAMGQEMEIPMNMTMLIDASAKSIEASTLMVSITTKKISGATTMMGQETQFSSDDKNMTSNPQTAELLKNINKEEEVLLEGGKIKSKATMATNGMPNNSEFAKMVFLTLASENIKEGFKWTEETSSDGSKSNTIYTITKLTVSEIEVTATTNTRVENTIQQMGMDMKQNLTGNMTSVRVYDAATAILKTDTSKLEMSGTILIMGNEAPINMTSISTTTVK